MEKTLAATMKHKVFPTTFQIVFDASLKAHKSDGFSHRTAIAVIVDCFCHVSLLSSTSFCLRLHAFVLQM